ncbi:MAG TPA: hypothetical protein VGN28_13340 [Blastococcus sp.]|nr:hypothetical protein [Blastococcus sp.]
MHIDWATLGVIAVVAAAAALAVSLLVAFALVGWSARTRRQPEGPAEDAVPALPAGAGTAVAVLCVLAAGLIVGYGLYLIVG